MKTVSVNGSLQNSYELVSVFGIGNGLMSKFSSFIALSELQFSEGLLN
jgi:hypothetical protein